MKKDRIPRRLKKKINKFYITDTDMGLSPLQIDEYIESLSGYLDIWNYKTPANDRIEFYKHLVNARHLQKKLSKLNLVEVTKEEHEKSRCSAYKYIIE